jgi:ferredoxin
MRSLSSSQLLSTGGDLHSAHLLRELLMSQEVVIDTFECTGCGGCVDLCPEVFGFREQDEKAYVIRPDAVTLDCVKEIIVLCPPKCISIE